MLFNSYAFLLAFLPVTLVGFFYFARFGKVSGAAWLAACSVFFYGWWDYRYIPLLMGSIGANFLAGRFIARRAGSAYAKRATAVAIVANLGLLGYYKYADFFLAGGNALLGTQWPMLKVILPIGISFFTFTQIAFLADAYAGKVTEYRFTYYVLFVTYFPHLIAGPVLHHKEMMPQFDLDRNYRPHAENFAVGLTIFSIGLAKKVLIADNLAGHADSVFDGGQPASLLIAWGAALSYTFQLYFDFSGYSDMAIGLARLFGVRLPLNFASPYKARNIAEFWRRWHMTLSRFLRDYLYIPMGGNRRGELRRNFNLMCTMVLGGLWHGAGWTFVVWGAMHGVFLVLNHAWQTATAQLRVRMHPSVTRFLSVSLTFVCVVLAWVYFRAPDIASANHIVLGMAGANGTAIPDAIGNRLGALGPLLQDLGIGTFMGGGAAFVEAWMWILGSAAIAFCLPNTQEIMNRYDPALRERYDASDALPRLYVAWRPGPRHAVATGLLLCAGLLALGRPTTFLYFQF